MSRLYKGDVPCPACGKTGTESRRWSRDSICHKCMDDLNEYRKIKDTVKRRKDTYTRLKIINNSIKCYSSNSDYSNLIIAIESLIQSLDCPEMDKSTQGEVVHGKSWGPFKIMRREDASLYDAGHYTVEVPFTLREDIALLIDGLITAIENYSEAIYLLGKKDGANLLKGLGTHAISPDEFIDKINR